MLLAREVGPDEHRKAEKQMEKVNENAGGEARKLVEEARRRVERG